MRANDPVAGGVSEVNINKLLRRYLQIPRSHVVTDDEEVEEMDWWRLIVMKWLKSIP